MIIYSAVGDGTVMIINLKITPFPFPTLNMPTLNPIKFFAMMILDILESEIFSDLSRPSYDLNVLNYDFWKLGSETAGSE